MLKDFLVGTGGGRSFPGYFIFLKYRLQVTAVSNNFVSMDMHLDMQFGNIYFKQLLQLWSRLFWGSWLKQSTLGVTFVKLFCFCQQEVLKSVDSKILQIHQALPKDTLFFVMFGCGDLSLVTRQVAILCNFRYRTSYLATLKWNLEPVSYYNV